MFAAAPIFRSPKVSTNALTTSACGAGRWGTFPNGVGTKESSSWLDLKLCLASLF
jgi:hypothetical protein